MFNRKVLLGGSALTVLAVIATGNIPPSILDRDTTLGMALFLGCIGALITTMLMRRP